MSKWESYMRDKKGNLGNQISIFTYLFFLAVIAFGIYAGVYLFFGEGYDFRGVESELLAYKIKQCIIQDKFDKEKFFAECNIDENVVRANNIIKICVDSQNCVEENKNIENQGVLFSVGSNFQACLLEGAKENKNYPKCAFVNFEKEGKKFEIIAGSKQNSRREIA